MHEPLYRLLEQLRLRGMAQSLERVLALADAEALPPAEVVRRLLEEEWRHRQERSLAYRLSRLQSQGSFALERR